MDTQNRNIEVVFRPIADAGDLHDNILSSHNPFNLAVRGYFGMWNNFKSMPMLLKFLTAHALACIAFLVGSIIPHDSFSINGQSVTYLEWWGSGVGVFASILGALMAYAGFLLVTRKPYSRQIYLGVLSLGLIAPYFKLGEYWLALFGAFVISMIAAYLFHKSSVKEYFDLNNALQTDRSTPGR